MNKKRSYILLFIAFAAVTGFKKAPKVSADKIFINGKVVTVDEKNSIAQAIAVKDGKILAVGTVADIEKFKGTATIVQDLQGKTILPGFVDGHSHFSSIEKLTVANLFSPPVGTVNNIADLVKELKALKEKKNIQDGEWITGFGYDQDLLDEKRHPTKEDLDAAFPNNPVAITHVSGHMLVANSYALRISNIDSSTKNPAGGNIVRKTGTNEPAGLIQEAAQALLKKSDKKPSLDEKLALLKEQQEYYASNGITTAQEGYTSFESLEILKEAANRGQLYIDVESLPAYQILDKVLADSSYKFGQIKNHLRLVGFKIAADGSPQGKTAFFTKPYLTEVPGCTHDDCSGFSNINQDQFNEAITKGFKNNIRTFIHCNGDATIDMYIKAIGYADSVLKTTSVGRRSVVIHSQFVRSDQLDSYKRLGMIPALFSNHAFFWGDVHIKNLGQDRAFFLSPLKTALSKGLIATNHTDYPVTPVNQLFLLWTSVARQSRSGQVIGPAEKLTPAESLRTITINGAYEYFEEKIKGSIEKGKLADLVILSEDPLTISTEKIKDIQVLETIKEGKTVYTKK